MVVNWFNVCLKLGTRDHYITEMQHTFWYWHLFTQNVTIVPCWCVRILKVRLVQDRSIYASHQFEIWRLGQWEGHIYLAVISDDWDDVKHFLLEGTYRIHRWSGIHKYQLADSDGTQVVCTWACIAGIPFSVFQFHMALEKYWFHYIFSSNRRSFFH